MCAMPKATLTLPDGTLVTIEGDPEEISRVLKLYSEGEEKKIAEDRPRRRVSLVWWLSLALLGVLVLGWIGLYGKRNSVNEAVDQAATGQVASITQKVVSGSAPSLLRA